MGSGRVQLNGTFIAEESWEREADVFACYIGEMQPVFDESRPLDRLLAGNIHTMDMSTDAGGTRRL
jgi:hypothetical protein